MRQPQNVLLLGLLPGLAASSPIAEPVDNAKQLTKQVVNANHIFNSIHDSMRQFGSSLNHNGMGMFIATVPESTELYHGTSKKDRINGTEWLAFEPEHSMIFARGPRGPGGPGHGGRGPPGAGSPPPGDEHEFNDDENGPPQPPRPDFGEDHPFPGRPSHDEDDRPPHDGERSFHGPPPQDGDDRSPHHGENRPPHDGERPFPGPPPHHGDDRPPHDGERSFPGAPPQNGENLAPRPHGERPGREREPWPAKDSMMDEFDREWRPKKGSFPPPPSQRLDRFGRPEHNMHGPAGDGPRGKKGPPPPMDRFDEEEHDRHHGRKETKSLGMDGIEHEETSPFVSHMIKFDDKGNVVDEYDIIDQWIRIEDDRLPSGRESGSDHDHHDRKGKPPHGDKMKGPKDAKHHGKGYAPENREDKPRHHDLEDMEYKPKDKEHKPCHRKGAGREPMEFTRQGKPMKHEDRLSEQREMMPIPGPEPRRGFMGAVSRFFGGQKPLPRPMETPKQHVPEPVMPGPFALNSSEEINAGYIHTYRTKHALRLLYLDGQSAAKSTKGTLDTQDIILLNATDLNGSRGMFGEKERADRMCELAATEWNEQIDGILRMEGGFEIILCSFAKHLDVISIKQSKPDGGMGGPPGSGGPDSTEDHFNYYEAIAARYHGIGGGRVRLDYENFVTTFDYPEAIYFDKTGRPRVQNDSSALAPLRSDLQKMILDNDIPDHKAIDWQSITDLIIGRFSDRISYMTSGRLTTLSALQKEMDRAMRPFIDYSARNASIEASRCAEQFWPAGADASSVAARAVKDTYETLCSTLAVTGLEATDYESALNTLHDLKTYLGWSDFKKCRGCKEHEICLLPIWPLGSEEDFVQPKCASSEGFGGGGHGGYWNDFGGPGGPPGGPNKGGKGKKDEDRVREPK